MHFVARPLKGLNKPLFARSRLILGPGANQTYNIMNIRELLPVLAILAGLVSVVVVSSLILGGYGLILSCSVVAVILGGSEDRDSSRG